MKVIGIDPGTATTGYGVIGENEKGILTAYDYGVILTLSTEPVELRLARLYNRIIEIIDLHRPDRGAVEKLYFKKNVSSALSVGQARGVIMLALGQRSIPVDEYNPMDVKLAVCGYGNAQKLQIQQMVRVILQLDEIPKPDDAADALAVGICHLSHSRSYSHEDTN
jgi:crossover junction endodeoxyribonuclease RuvC